MIDSSVFWVAGPYAVTLVFIAGMIWRYRYDRYGWTSRSSQLYESKLLRIASPAFHAGILLALLGHIGGLVVPSETTRAIGISESAYHAVAVGLGSIAGLLVVIGLIGLVYRRRTNTRVFLVTTRMDKAMYVLLGLVTALGVYNTIGVQLFGLGGHSGGYDYRETVSVWFRSIAWFQPRPELMVHAPLSFQLHIIAAMLLIAITPVTRLVHIFSVPVGYLSRPYLVYRSRDAAARPAPRGWEPSASE